MWSLKLFIAAALSLDAVFAAPAGPFESSNAKDEKRQAPPVDYFAGHASSSTIQWYDCYADLKCARLEVPLDYDHRVPGDVFKLALVKLPARSDTPYKGTFFLLSPFLNSNVDFMDQIGRYYQPGFGYGWDFVAWDARGQGYTTPTLQCFANDAAKTAYTVAKDAVPEYGGFNGTYQATPLNFLKNVVDNQAIAKKLGDGCATYYGKYLPYMGTPDNVRDLNNIVTQLSVPSKSIAAYFYSYYTMIGVTYASMYPNGFDRMILDGQVNAELQYSIGDNGASSLQDAEKGLQIFFDSCAAAPKCNWPADPLYTCAGCYFGASTAAGVKARYEALKSKYYNKPFKSNPPSTVCGDCLTTYSQIAHSILDAIELPADGIQFAMVQSLRLLELETGRAFTGGAMEYFANTYPASVRLVPYFPALKCADQAIAISLPLLLEADLTIANATSSQVGTNRAFDELQCGVWPLSAKVKNPFPGFSLLKKTTKGKMMFIGNVADAVQPLDNAKKMAAKFTNAGVLTVNAMGTTTFFSGNSNCIGTFLGPFMDQGIVPAAGSFCNDVTQGPFGITYQKDYRA